MERLPCTTSEVEIVDGHVVQPQFTLIWDNPGEAVLTVHFMENSGYSIDDPHAVSVGPDISVRYTPVSHGGMIMMSLSLRKLSFRFSGLTQREYKFSLRPLKLRKK